MIIVACLPDLKQQAFAMQNPDGTATLILPVQAPQRPRKPLSATAVLCVGRPDHDRGGMGTQPEHAQHRRNGRLTWPGTPYRATSRTLTPTKMDVSQMLNELQQRQANELEARRDELNTLRRETMEATKLRDASHGTIRWDDHARRAARANGESGAGRAAILNAPREAAVNWRPWLWLVPVLIFGLVVGANYPGMLESWGLGGPGARHAEDVERAREMQALVGPYRPEEVR